MTQQEMANKMETQHSRIARAESAAQRGSIDFMLRALYTVGATPADWTVRSKISRYCSIYLTDFGLVLDTHFALNDEEEKFFESNTYYDCGKVIWCIRRLINRTYEALPDSDKNQIREKYGVQDGGYERDMRPLYFSTLRNCNLTAL